MGRRTEEGDVFFQGRKEGHIKVPGGIRTSLEEVAAAVSSVLDGGHDCACVEDPERPGEVVAFVRCFGSAVKKKEDEVMLRRKLLELPGKLFF